MGHDDNQLRRAGLVRRHPVLFGFVLMFAFTWPIDLWAAADSHGWTSVRIWPILPMLVGYGFVAAALVMTGSWTAGRGSAGCCGSS